MTKQKTRSASRTTVKVIAETLGVHRTTLENWRSEGCPGLPPAEVDFQAVKAWADSNGKRADAINPARTGLRKKKLAEEVRKLVLANQAKEDQLIPRAAIESGLRLAIAGLEPVRKKSIEEHPLLFGCADPADVETCRKIVREKIWPEVFRIMEELAEKFAPVKNTKGRHA
jgi:hypothetical protein